MGNIIYIIISVVLVYFLWKIFKKVLKVFIFLLLLMVGTYFVTPEFSYKKELEKNYKYSKFFVNTKVGRKILYIYSKAKIKKITKDINYNNDKTKNRK